MLPAVASGARRPSPSEPAAFPGQQAYLERYRPSPGPAQPVPASKRAPGSAPSLLAVPGPPADPLEPIAVVVHAAPRTPPRPLPPAGEVAQPVEAAPTWGASLRVASRVGAFNAGRRLAAGLGAVALGGLAARQVTQALSAPASSAGAVAGVVLAALGGGVLGVHASHRLAGRHRLWPVAAVGAAALASGAVPPLVLTLAGAAPGARATQAGLYVGRLVASLVADTLVQGSDGALPRARLVDARPGPQAPSRTGVMQVRPAVSALFYGAAGVVMGRFLAPQLDAVVRTLVGDLGEVPQAALAAQLAQLVAQVGWELVDALTVASVAHASGLTLEPVPAGAPAAWREPPQAAGRVRDFTAMRLLIEGVTSAFEAALVPMGEDHPAAPWLRGIRDALQGLVRANGALVQETHPLRRANEAWAAQFRPTEVYLGSSDSGLDVRAAQGEAGAGSASPVGLRRRHQARPPAPGELT